MLDMMKLKPGDRLLLVDKSVVEVIEDMEDGMWVQVLFIEVPNRPDDVGTTELCHAQDILRIIESGSVDAAL
jgi:hypothetical protein